VNGRLLRQGDFVPYLEHVAEMDLTFFLRLLSDLSQHDMQHILPRIDVPTLIIAGEKDTFTPLFRSVEMAEMVSHSELIIVPGGTHVAPLELPDLVTAAFDRFFDRNDLRQPHSHTAAS
jgi:pimeloyl-ACP methyl ester carboxylesterase